MITFMEERPMRMSVKIVSWMCIYLGVVIGVAPVAATEARSLSAPVVEQITSAEDLMLVADLDRSRSGEAALAFAQILPDLDDTTSPRTRRDVAACILWCQRRMSPDDREAMRRGSEKQQALWRRVEEVVEAQVPAAESNVWMQGADHFALQNPDRPLLIVARYLEVAERFVGTPESLAAQQKSFAYQAQVTMAHKPAAHATIFSSKPTAKEGAAELPDSGSQKSAITLIKKLYREEYARRGREHQQAFSQKLLAIARATMAEPHLRWALGSEALRLAQAAGDLPGVLIITDEMASWFTGWERDSMLIEVLGKMRGDAPQAMLSLLADPADAAASTIAGRQLALKDGRWDLGLPLLSNGDNVVLKHLSSCELILGEEASAEEILELADAWNALADDLPRSERDAAIARGGIHYQRVLPMLKGVTRQRVERDLLQARPAMDRAEGIIDLFPLLGLEQGRFQGRWKTEGRVLVVEKNDTGDHLTVPLVPKGDYVYTVEFNLRSTGAAMFLIPIGPNSLNFFISPKGSTVHLINGEMVRSIDDAAVARPGQRQTFTATVRQSGEKIQLTIHLDGVTALEWSGPSITQFGNHRKALPSRPGAFGLGAWKAEVAFYRATVRMLSGTADPLKD